MEKNETELTRLCASECVANTFVPAAKALRDCLGDRMPKENSDSLMRLSYVTLTCTKNEADVRCSNLMEPVKEDEGDLNCSVLTNATCCFQTLLQFVAERPDGKQIHAKISALGQRCGIDLYAMPCARPSFVTEVAIEGCPVGALSQQCSARGQCVKGLPTDDAQCACATGYAGPACGVSTDTSRAGCESEWDA
ncbi:MAG: hypothetical protein ACOVP8_04155, partial [Phycisphaerales bacterium]